MSPQMLTFSRDCHLFAFVRQQTLGTQLVFLFYGLPFSLIDACCFDGERTSRNGLFIEADVNQITPGHLGYIDNLFLTSGQSFSAQFHLRRAFDKNSSTSLVVALVLDFKLVISLFAKVFGLSILNRCFSKPFRRQRLRYWQKSLFISGKCPIQKQKRRV